MQGRALLKLKRAVYHSTTARAIANHLWPAGRPVVVRDGPLRNFRLLVPMFSGGARYASGSYEKTEVELVSRLLPSANIRTFCDVGAHIGYYSILVDRVTQGKCTSYAFEPSPASFACLAYNLAHCCTGKFKIHYEAIGATMGIGEFAGPSGQVADSLVEYRPSHYGSARSHRRMVSITTLDDALAKGDTPKAILVKVDVEGAEAAVLTGASTLIESARPFWLIECHTKCLADEVIHGLSARDYSLYLLSDDGSYISRVLAIPDEDMGHCPDFLDWAIGSNLVSPIASG